MTVAAVSWAELWRVFGRIGLLSFGGPAAQISLMHRELVDNRKWLSDPEYLRALSFCMLLPGPEAMQLATYSGWRLRGITGGLLAGFLFVFPGAALIVALAALYVAYGDLPFIASLFLGIKACVVVIVIEALLRVSRRALNRPMHRVIAIVSFFAIFIFGAPFPLVVVASALVGALTLSVAPELSADRSLRPSLSMPILLIGGVLWALPLVAAKALGAEFLLGVGLFFSKLALVTFGGAYAVLTYMTQTVVQTHGWVTTPEMMDALGLAETTPGPLILVTVFVAYLAGVAQGGTLVALAAAGMTLWVTFVPCFLWIFAFAPYVEWLATRPRLSAALEGIMAAVVGVIASLAAWFAFHLFFAATTIVVFGPISVDLPRLASIQPAALFIAGLAAIGLLRMRLPLLAVLALSAATGAILHVIG